MFTRKKPFWKRTWFYGLLIGILGMGIFVNTVLFSEGERAERVSKQAPTESEESGAQEDAAFAPDRSGLGDALISEDESWEDGYLLLLDQDRVDLYLVNQGEKMFLKETGIVYELMGEEDQILFQQGIAGLTEEDLNRILQDFES